MFEYNFQQKWVKQLRNIHITTYASSHINTAGKRQVKNIQDKSKTPMNS